MAQKQYFIRVPEDMYEAIKTKSEADQRSINGMGNVLMGYALNHYPQGVGTPIEITLPPEKIKELKLESIACPKCGMVSYNQNDIEQKYCGNCHQYHADMVISKKSEATPQTSDLFATPKVEMPAPVPEDNLAAGEFACCLNELQPCKHWKWDIDSGEGYINILSGRKLEVE